MKTKDEIKKWFLKHCVNQYGNLDLDSLDQHSQGSKVLSTKTRRTKQDMAKHLLAEIKIDSFRGLRNLSLAHLTQIVVVVGKPGSGKTSLFEAIAERSCPSAMRLNRTSIDSSFAILDDEAKGGCLAVLRSFDDSVESISEDPESGKWLVESSAFGKLPIDRCGDCALTAFAVAKAISVATGGVVMIDGLDSGLSFETVKFAMCLCLARKIKLFVATNSTDVLEWIAEAERKLKSGEVCFVTLKRDSETARTLSRVMSFTEVEQCKEIFDFDVRE